MRNLVTVFLIGTGATLSACQQSAGIDLEAERAALREAARAYHEAARRLDTAAVSGFYADGATVLPPGADSATGMPAVREFVGSFAATPGIAIGAEDPATIVEVAASGDMGYTLASVRVSVSGPGGTPVEEDFRDFHLWKKQGGQWKLAVDIWNSAEPSGPAAELAAADRNAIATVRAQEAEGFSTGDRAALNGLFTEDVIFMPPGEPAFAGAAAHDAWVTAFLGEFQADAVYTDSQLTLDGDLAYETLAFRMTLTPTSGGDAVIEQGKGLHIYKRQPDGRWKIAVDVWNTDN